MKSFNLTKIVSLMLACIMLVGMMAIPTFAAEPTVAIVSTNVEFGETIRLIFAIDAREAATVVIRDEEGTNMDFSEYELTAKEVADLGTDTAYIMDVGVPAQAIAKQVTVTVTDGNAQAKETYSVLEYLYTRLNVSTNVSPEQRAMYESLLEYAKKAEAVLNPNAEVKIADYGFVNCVDCSPYYIDENNEKVNCDATGIYPNGTVLRFTTDLVAEDGKVVVYQVDEDTVTVEDMEADGVEVNGNMTVTAITQKDDAPIYETFTADFNTVGTTSSYGERTTTSGWKATNCAVMGGGTSDSNPKFKVFGDASTRAFTMNGKTSAKGSIVSPTLSGGISKLTFQYTHCFGDTKGVNITITIKQNGTKVATKDLVNSNVTQLQAHDFEWDLAGENVAVTGDFTIEIINNSPSNSTSNKDRVSIWNLEWTNNPTK